MNSNWHKIWSNCSEFLLDSKADKKDVFLELKRIDGFDIAQDGMPYEALSKQNDEIFANLSFDGKNAMIRPIRSIYEVGCGCGANLYYMINLMIENDGHLCIGGNDYSAKLIDIAKRHIPVERWTECEASEAIDLNTDIKYDAVFSNSVFSYFDNYEYARTVLEKMLEKARFSIGLIDVHDVLKKDEFLSYRRQIIEDYDEKYKNLGKLFYSKEFFLKFADEKRLDVKFCISDVEKYWNNPFIFNVYLYKRTLP